MLQSSYGDINSVLGFRLKREILLALAHETVYPQDEDTRRHVMDKYSRYVIPVRDDTGPCGAGAGGGWVVGN